MNETLSEIPTILGQTLPFTMSPTLDIFLISLLGSLFITLVNKYLSDQIKIKALRKEMKQLQKESRKMMAKDPKKAQALQQQLMKKNLENMKHAMNPKIMAITMLPMLFLFFLIRTHYGGFGEFFTLFGYSIGFLGMPWGWLGTYIAFSIINSIALKKLLDVA